MEQIFLFGMCQWMTCSPSNIISEMDGWPLAAQLRNWDGFAGAQAPSISSWSRASNRALAGFFAGCFRGILGFRLCCSQPLPWQAMAQPFRPPWVWSIFLAAGHTPSMPLLQRDGVTWRALMRGQNSWQEGKSNVQRAFNHKTLSSRDRNICHLRKFSTCFRCSTKPWL